MTGRRQSSRGSEPRASCPGPRKRHPPGSASDIRLDLGDFAASLVEETLHALIDGIQTLLAGLRVEVTLGPNQFLGIDGGVAEQFLVEVLHRRQVRRGRPEIAGDSIVGKKMWLGRELDRSFANRGLFVKAVEKQDYSGPGKVLIDDSPMNIEQWQARGGIGILHKGDATETLAVLNSIER